MDYYEPKMDVLSPEMVFLRTKTKELVSVKKLNCWASDLSDVSLIKDMPNLEVLTLSMNNIVTLKHVENCSNLVELYIRNNKIDDLKEIFHLKELKNLKILWLDGNPCANSENYRLDVLKNLPNLEKLDNITVTKEELSKALIEGREITEPPGYTEKKNLIIEITSSSIESTIDLFNSTVYENEMKNLINPILDEFKTEDIYPKTTSIETNIDTNLEITQTLEESSETETNISTLNEAFESMTTELLVSTNTKSKEKDDNVLSAILLLLKSLNKHEIDKVIEECQIIKNSKSN